MMKKIILTLCLVAFYAIPVFAQCDYTDFCAQKPYDLSSKAGQITSNVTGMTFLSEKVAQAIIRHELKKETKAKFKVEMKSYSANDLMHGRFKSLRISGKKLNIEGIHLSSLDVKTLCNFNYVVPQKKSVVFKENMVLGFATEISSDDLSKTVKSSGYLDMLNSVNFSGMGITFFKLSAADVKIKNDKLYFTIKVTSPMSTRPLDIIVRSDLKVEDGQIVLTKVDLVNIFTVIDLSRMTYLLNAINPLTFSVDIFNNKDSKVSVQSVDIKGDKIFIKGNIFVPKSHV